MIREFPTELDILRAEVGEEVAEARSLPSIPQPTAPPSGVHFDADGTEWYDSLDDIPNEAPSEEARKTAGAVKEGSEPEESYYSLDEVPNERPTTFGQIPLGKPNVV